MLEQERKLIEVIKDKIITRLYAIAEEKVVERTDKISDFFKLEPTEKPFLEKAENELEADGLIICSKEKIALTAKGEEKYKEIYN